MFLQDSLDSVSTDLVPQLLQGTFDPGVAPALVVLGHPHDEGRDLGRRLRPPLPSPRAPDVLLDHEVSVPAQNMGVPKAPVSTHHLATEIPRHGNHEKLLFVPTILADPASAQDTGRCISGRRGRKHI